MEGAMLKPWLVTGIGLLLCLDLSESSTFADSLTNEWTTPNTTANHPDRLSRRQPNRPPVAYAGKERVAAVGEAVAFHGQGSSPDQEIVEYSWDFESDGLIDFVSSRTASTTHTFTEPGEYRCLLKVKDSSGQIAQCVRRILVIPANADRTAAENALHPVTKVKVNLADGVIHRYAILFNGANEERFWKDMTLCYDMLTNHYGFSPSDIFLLNYDGTSPNGDNPGGVIDYPATLEGLQTVISNLATLVDSDDEVSFWITDHGRGYSGPLSEGGAFLGYLDGRASVDPGDEPDFLESDFKLRSLMTGGDYLCNHGLNVWKVFRSDYGGGKVAYYRNKYVSHFDNVYIETLGKSVSDHDVFIERFVDYLRGDFNRDGFIDTSIGEVFDYDGDGVPPYDPVTGKFDEDDWGAVDVLEDDFNRLNTQMPEGAWPYQLFDNNFEGKLCIDLAYDGIQLHVDGRDEDGMGLFDWMDVNQDGDTNDIISVDEGIMTYSGAIYDDDLRAMLAQLSAAKITIVAEQCFSGGLVEDLSSTNRVICTATIEDAVSYGDVFIRGFVAALDGRDEYGTSVNADTDGNGAVSMLEAFNYAAAYDFFDEIPQYDDDGDGISHAWWSLGSDGSLGANTYLSDGNVSSNTVNDWTKTTSGYWEEPYWSLGRLPAMDQDLVAFRNPGWKALAIGADTTANYPNSLAINYLTVEAPADSFNQLLLNYAGLAVPLSVNSDLVLGTNGSLVSYYSALRGGSLYLSAPATFSEGSMVIFSKIVVGANAPAELNLTDSSLSAGLLILSQGAAGTLNQSGGSNQASNLQMYAGSVYTLSNGTFVANSLDLQSLGGTGLAQFTVSGGHMDVQGPFRLGLPQSTPDARGEFLLQAGWFQATEVNFLNGTFTQTGGTNVTSSIALPWLDNSRGDYFLSGGTLISSNISLGAILSPSTPPGIGNFTQSGGVHTNVSMGLAGEIRHQSVTHYGSYSLGAGLLVSDAVRLLSGAFTQSGGTNRIQELALDEAGSFLLNAGELVTSNTTVDTSFCVRSDFTQSGGSHTVKNRLLLQDFVRYKLLAGTLSAPNIEVGPGAELLIQGGSVSNSGVFTIRGGAVRAAGQTQQLGQLQVIGDPVLVCVGTQPTTSTLDVGVGSGTGATALRFRDSRDVPWSGSALSILYWSPTTNGFGPDHIFVGTNSQGLTASQLSQLTFVNPIGWPAGNYPARIQPTGEIVPGVLPPLGFTRSPEGLILSWSGDYELVTATNVMGPYLPILGASSPFTNTLTDPQRYFRLRLTFP